MEVFTGAFYDYVHRPDSVTDEAVRAATRDLEAAFVRDNTTLSDQMAWRSVCAYGWWAAVEPVPESLPGRTPRPNIPSLPKDAPFWRAGCCTECLPDQY
jgi:hypothetical protein